MTAARPRAVAAVDCGTNSTRLLVAGADGTTIERLMTITRLGEGVDGNRRLAEQAIARTVATLRDYRQVADRHGVGRVRAVATSAVRDAANGGELLDAAQAVLGVRPEVLSGQEEGRLSFVGATAALDPATGPFAVVDIGGGSTELVVGTSADEPLAVESVDVGCVRVTERHLRSDPPTSAELDAATRSVSDLLRAAVGRTGAAAARTLVGLAGTVSAAAILDLGLDSYRRDLVHHHVLSRASVGRLLDGLAAIPAAVRAERRGVEKGRADVIVGGLVVLAAVMDVTGLDRCLVSESDILDGMVAALLYR